MFDKVIVSTDLLEACDASVLTAIDIVKQYNGRLYILHVLESDSTIYREFVKHYKTGEEIVNCKTYEETVKKEIDKNCASALKHLGNYEIRVTTGFPWEEILRWVREVRANLIILGSHTDRAEEKNVVRGSGTIGSTLEGVIKRERSPVMVVNRTISQKKLGFKRVMVSTDFSKSCEYAFQFAIKFAQKNGSKLFLFHLMRVLPAYEHSQVGNEEELNILKKKINALCKEIPKGIDHEYCVSEGNQPHLGIQGHADKNDVDLIVMGSHTNNNEGKWYVGSTVERVSNSSICPVVVITDPKALLSMNRKLNT